MPQVYFCLKCSMAVYEHSKWCRSKITLVYHYTRLGVECELESPEYNNTNTYKAHELKDLYGKPYCKWNRDYSRLRRVYMRMYDPANWKAIGWFCERCGNFIKT